MALTDFILHFFCSCKDIQLMLVSTNFIVDECLLMRLSYTKRTKSGAESLMEFVWSGVV